MESFAIEALKSANLKAKHNRDNWKKRALELEKLVREVMFWHRDKESAEYNDCDINPCMWCILAQKAIDGLPKGKK